MTVKKITISDPKLVTGVAELPGRIVDYFRREFGVWTSSTAGINYVPATLDFSSKIAISKIGDVEKLPDDALGRQRYSQQITVFQKGMVRDPSDPEAQDEFHDHVFGLLGVGTTHLDHITTAVTDYTAEEALASGTDINANAGVEYVYNYFDIDYEALLQTTKNHETIPSLYAMLDESTIAGTQVADQGDPDYLDGIGIADIDILKAPTAERLKDNKHRYVSSGRIKFRNQIVPIENTSLLADYNSSKYLFPMYTEINIKLDENNEIAGIMEESSLGGILTRDVEGIPAPIPFDPTGAAVPLPPQSVRAEDTMYSFSVIDANGDVVNDLSTVPATTVDLMEWLMEDWPDWYGSNPLPEDHSLIGPLSSSPTGDTTTYGDISHGLGLDVLLTGLTDLAERERRTFQDLIDGEQAYSETLMYKISKYLGNDITQGSPIQTFYFMNSADVREYFSAGTNFTFCDTQVKYGKEYSYAVTAYQVVLGMEYEYNNLDAREKDGVLMATFDFVATEVAKLIEIPLFMSTGKILDNPPLDPEVAFTPFMGKPNLIRIGFDTKIGIANVEPVSLTDAEASDYDQILLNQKSTDGTITFKTDDFAAAYSIYRMRQPPLGYEDFPESPYRVVSTLGPDSRNKLQASSASITLRQLPNIKYYYMFRTIDIHGGLSNPSIIYEIELYNDGGVGYPIIRQYEFTSPDPKTPVKTARKLIQIIPRITQAFLNESASGLVDEAGVLQNAHGKSLVLGVEDDPLFGKRFKIRLTSKTTGKKLDINIDFNKKKVRTV